MEKEENPRDEFEIMMEAMEKLVDGSLGDEQIVLPEIENKPREMEVIKEEPPEEHASDARVEADHGFMEEIVENPTWLMLAFNMGTVIQMKIVTWVQ
ncbi:hypothetical protein JCGZ_19746 [Jatropha curcas]|uniref:Uncharacterized protein n=1 Tax=Jatropha curcas TaxID=180498 RepID=A0A067LJX8_JATCU|nr:hypothetical protein JCGZ_19746 [Jatropha curcas]